MEGEGEDKISQFIFLLAGLAKTWRKVHKQWLKWKGIIYTIPTPNFQVSWRLAEIPFAK